MDEITHDRVERPFPARGFFAIMVGSLLLSVVATSPVKPYTGGEQTNSNFVAGTTVTLYNASGETANESTASVEVNVVS